MKWHCNKTGQRLITDDIAHRIANVVSTNATGTRHAIDMDDVKVGHTVLVPGYGDWRRGVVLKIGRTNVTVGFTTRAALDGAKKHDHGFKITVSSAPVSGIRVYPGGQP